MNETNQPNLTPIKKTCADLILARMKTAVNVLAVLIALAGLLLFFVRGYRSLEIAIVLAAIALHEVFEYIRKNKAANLATAIIAGAIALISFHLSTEEQVEANSFGVLNGAGTVNGTNYRSGEVHVFPPGQYKVGRTTGLQPVEKPYTDVQLMAGSGNVQSGDRITVHMLYAVDMTLQDAQEVLKVNGNIPSSRELQDIIETEVTATMPRFASLKEISTPGGKAAFESALTSRIREKFRTRGVCLTKFAVGFFEPKTE